MTLHIFTKYLSTERPGKFLQTDRKVPRHGKSKTAFKIDKRLKDNEIGLIVAITTEVTKRSSQ